ncbi:DUF1013 domain-containing protein [soil metagenome]
MSRAPLMPKATAVWLIENTSLTFRQIADYCNLHELEVKGIADGDVAQGIKGLDPVTAGQITREEIEAGEKDSEYRLKFLESKVNVPIQKATKGPRYTPVSKRSDRPDAIAWLLRYHPELPDSQVMKLVGTTKTTIQSIRERSHWNSPNIKPVDPVSLGLCSQLDLDMAVQKAARKAGKGIETTPTEVRTLIPAAEAIASRNEPMPEAEPKPKKDDFDPDSVFAKLKGLKLPEESQ